MKIVVRMIGGVFLLFLLSVVLVNIIEPVFHKKVGKEYQEQIALTEYEDDLPGKESVRCIDDNEEALLYRLRMIGNARESIVMATFDLRGDENGTAVMSALLDAADRGVKVQLLVDGIYQILYLKYCDAFNALCSHENVDARYYNPVNLRNIYRLNYRMHDKYLMIDDRMYMLGGRNVSDIFLGSMHKGSNVDRDVIVYNTESASSGLGISGSHNSNSNVAAGTASESFMQLREYFNQIWKEPCVQNAGKKIKPSAIDAEYAKLRECYKGLEKKYGDFEAFDQWQEGAYEADKITLITNGTQAANKEPMVLETIRHLALQGEEVLIQTPYVICNNAMYDVLQQVADQAQTSIFLNAVTRGSNPWGCTDYLNNKKKILGKGINIYELMNEYAVHTKAVLVDDTVSVVGSYNLDMRSTYLDTELMLVIDSEELNAHIRQTLTEYREKSIEVLSDGTETKGSLYEEKKLSGGKKLFYQILRVIIRPFRHLL